MPSQGRGGTSRSAGTWANRTECPSSKTGRQTGLPGSRSAVTPLQSGLSKVGPTSRAPSVSVASRSSRPSNASSVAKEPRLSPKTTRRGRVAAGSVSHLACTASNSARPASVASSSVRTETQLGR